MLKFLGRGSAFTDEHNSAYFIENDELVEITPKNIRIRKKILDPKQRMRANKK